MYLIILYQPEISAHFPLAFDFTVLPEIVLEAVTIPLSKFLYGSYWKSEMISSDVCSQYSLESILIDENFNWIVLLYLTLWF